MIDGRTNKGQFAVGNKASPGRPKRPTEAQYLVKLSNVCTLEDWEAISKRAVDDAKKGDHQARAWLSKYLMGDTPTLVQAIAIENLNTSEVMYSTPEENHVSAIMNSLAALMGDLPENEQINLDGALLQLSKMFAKSASTRRALQAIGERFDDIDLSRPESVLYDVVSLITDKAG